VKQTNIEPVTCGPNDQPHVSTRLATSPAILGRLPRVELRPLLQHLSGDTSSRSLAKWLAARLRTASRTPILP